MIFDTSILIGILKDEKLINRLGKVDRVRIASVSAFELLRGATYLSLYKGSKRELEVVMGLLEEVEILPFTWDDVRIASYIWARLKKAGSSVPDPDVIVAAMAIRTGEKVVTGDEDFLKIKKVSEGLEVKLIR